MGIRSHPAVRDAWAGPRWALLLLCGVLAGCGSTQHVGEQGLPDAQGIASYYADKFVGRTTANGEIYDHQGLTAAHRSLPFGTRVRTTRIDAPAQPSVVVRINDRGPFKDGRIIDLSKAAAGASTCFATGSRRCGWRSSRTRQVPPPRPPGRQGRSRRGRNRQAPGGSAGPAGTAPNGQNDAPTPIEKEVDPANGRDLLAEHRARRLKAAGDYGFSVATKSARSPDGVLTTSVISTEKLFSRSRLRS